MTTLYCCQCQSAIEARLTDGQEIYPHRPGLHTLPFWKCDICGNYVGCHHKTRNRTKPLGPIPSPELRTLRAQIHAAIDPIWRSGRMSRRSLYATLSDALGYEYHTGHVRSVDDAQTVLRIAATLQEI